MGAFGKVNLTQEEQVQVRESNILFLLVEPGRDPWELYN